MTDIAQIRTANLQMLVAGSGNKSEFARRAGLSSAHLRQMVNVQARTGEVLKNCGEKLARKIEANLGLKPNWLDILHSGEASAPPEPEAYATPTVPAILGDGAQHERFTPMQRAVLDAFLKICQHDALSDRECISLLESWKDKLS